LVALAAGASSDGGDYTATDLKPSDVWTAGGNAGNFSWAYPLRLPPGLGGPVPQVQLTYSSQAVDGQTAATNAQPSWAGEGFNWQPGAIERSYRSCSDDGQTGSSDVCWAGDNATITLNGHSSVLVFDSVSGLWRPQDEDGSKIERLVNPALDNGDLDGEYWKVTTTDGIQYFFGLHRLPGAPAGTVTNSVFFQPVFGNGANEPCHGSTFAASSCAQAYRWNLDYVVDPHNNTMSLYYTRETNQYARNGSSGDTPTYVRGGYVNEIDYGTRQDGGVDSAFAGTAPTRVLFEVTDRCITAGATCTTATANQSNWPDVPLDLLCSGTGCAGRVSPAFFTSKKLSAITTQVASGNKTWRRVERWTLGHDFKLPGDGNQMILWLRAIGHCGVDDNTCLPKVTFTSVQKSNRVDRAGTTNSIIRFRIQSIVSESGGVIAVTYSAPECVAGATMPASPDTNTMRCFPQYWTPLGSTSPKLEYFHKYVVTSVAEGDLVGGTPDEVTYYTYPGSAAWHRDENPMALSTRRTWNQWRGYDLVRTVHGANTETQSKTETVYFRGMNGDLTASGAARSASIMDSDGGTWVDSDWFAGSMRETVTYLGTTSTVVAKTKNDPYQFGPTATYGINGITLRAYVTDTAVTTKTTPLDHAPWWRITRSASTFTPDRTARTSQVDDEGDIATTADDECTSYTFGDNAAGTMPGLPVRTEKVGVRCAATPNRAVDVLSDVRLYYDGATTFGTTVSRGEVTRTEQLANWNNGNPIYQMTAHQTFDANGRVLESFDALEHRTATAYTPAAGPVTQIVETNPKNWTTTTTVDPAWGLPVTTMDANGRRTDGSYDGLGRLTSVWLPGRVKGSQTADATYTYAIRNSGGPTTVTKAQLNTAGTGYVVTIQLLDGKLRLRQTQVPAVGGGRQITESLFNTRGLSTKSRPPYFNSSAPGTALFVPTGDNVVPAQTVTTYDGAGRPTVAALQINAVERSRTTTVYGGDHTDVSVPAGGTATSSSVDARGQLTQLRTYHGDTATAAVASDVSIRTYTRSGELASLTDGANNRWTYTYDQMRRRIGQSDPDKGASTYTYNAVGQRLTETDSRGVTLVHSYDELGRQTAQYLTSATPANKRAEWVYDTLQKGQVSSTIRYEGGGNYVNEVTGYTPRYQATGTRVTVPASAGAQLAGQYVTSHTYNADGSLASTTLPAKTGSATIGGLPAETVTFGYNNVGMPTTQTGLNTYVTETGYLQTGQLSSINATIGNGKDILQYWTYEPGTMRLVGHQVLGDFPAVVAQDVHYGYDSAGNVTSVADRLAQYPGAGPDDTQCFRYDGSRRIAEAWTPTSGDCASTPTATALGGPAPYWNSYTYDAAGSRKSETRHAAAGNLTRTYNYPAAGAGVVRPHAVTSIVTSGTTTGTDSYAYDATGNATTRNITGKPGQSLAWNPDGQLASVTDSSGATTSYVYDAAGNRSLAKDPTGTTLYLGTTELRLSGGTVTATRLYNHAGQTVAVRTGAGLSWQTSDPQGTSQLSFQATDLAMTRRRTDAFGNTRGAATTWPTSRGFLGASGDGTGLTHLGARDYDPAAGHFLSADPLLDTKDVQQLASYSYANNNPATESDPDGRDPGGRCELADLCGPPDSPHGAAQEQGDKIVWRSDPKDKHNHHPTVKTTVFVRKKVVMVTFDCGPRIFAPANCRSGTYVLGRIAKCGNGTDPDSPACWVGGDGRVHDLAGNRSCARADSADLCAPVPKFVNRGCGPFGDSPSAPAPQFIDNPKPPKAYAFPKGADYLNPDHMMAGNNSGDGLQCPGGGEQCRFAKLIDDALSIVGYCSSPMCNLASLAGGLYVAGYYASTGDWGQAAERAGKAIINYRLSGRIDDASSAYLTANGAQKAQGVASWYVNYGTGVVVDGTADFLLGPPQQ
jgi:RHS repeat-associated protein